ncbi:MAG: hypothetical protein JSW41_01965 [Candidatus Aenigmatarchaeota archaeon]|nr:MAG: hypothetical protein JSW41_01965 [Candidatus Aenigmarchaeota archaeon]
MSLEVRKPKVLGTREIFLFWLKNLEREKPYLLVKRRPSKSLQDHRTTEVWYTIKHELNFLNQRLLDIDEEIIRLEKKDTERYEFTSYTVKIFELKKEIYDIRKKIDQLTLLPPDEKKLLMTYKLFHEITCKFNKKAVEAIVDGDTVNLGNRLGELRIKKINRFAPSVDWPASKARRKELISQDKRPRSKEYPGGENWFIYRNSEFYLRFSWTKRFRSSGVPMLRNGKVYAFYPTSNSSGDEQTRVLGAKGILTEANNQNKNLHLRYETVTY